MSIYQRGDVWYYLFYINGRRYRGSTKTKNQKQAERVEARKRGSLRRKVSRYGPSGFLWCGTSPNNSWNGSTKLRLSTKPKTDYKNGRRLILKTALSGMRMDQITSDDVETTKFHESPYSRNCAIRTLRRMLGKARDWKLHS